MSVIAEFLFALGFSPPDRAPLDEAQEWAEETADEAAKSWENASKRIGTALAGVGVAMAGAAVGLFKIVDGATKAGDEIAKASRTAGVGAESFQRLTFAADRSGVNMQTLQKGLLGLTQKLERARVGVQDMTGGSDAFSDALSTIGVKLTDLGPDAEENMRILADGFKSVQDPSRRTAALMEIFGAEAGPRMASLIDAGSEGIAEMAAEAERLGLVMSQDALDASESFQDSLADMRKTVASLGRDVAMDLIPVFQDTIDETKEWITSNRELIRQDMGGVVRDMAEALRSVIPLALEVASAVAKIAQGLGNIAGEARRISNTRDFLRDNPEQLAAAQAEAKATGRPLAAVIRDRMRFRDRGEDLESDEWEAITTGDDGKLAAVAELDAQATASLSPMGPDLPPGFGTRTSRPRGGGGKRQAEAAVDYSVEDFEFLDIMGDELQRLADRHELSQVAVASAIQAGGRSLKDGASLKVAKQAALSRLGSLAGQNFGKASTSDPLLSQILGDDDVPDVELSSIARGAEPQVLISTINNTFHLDAQVDVSGAGQPVAVADEVADHIFDRFVTAIHGATKTVKIKDAR